MASMEQYAIQVEHGVFRDMPIKADSDGTPVLRLVFELRGRGALEKVDLTDLATLLGKPITLGIIDNQLRIKE